MVLKSFTVLTGLAYKMPMYTGYIQKVCKISLIKGSDLTSFLIYMKRHGLLKVHRFEIINSNAVREGKWKLFNLGNSDTHINSLFN
jgi:hypothetical protein